jgi:ankyrin repeat protein
MKTAKAVRQALGRLPKSLEESYDVIYNQMLDADPDTLRNSEAVIRWLLCAKRQLRTGEFISAIYASTHSDGDDSSDNDDEPLLVEEILDICCNLVVWDQSLDTFRTAHLSVREYFEKMDQFGKIEIHSRALEVCVDALRGCIRQETTEDLKLYAATFWPNHCSDLGPEGPTGRAKTKLKSFLFDGCKASRFYLNWVSSLQIMLEAGSATTLEPDQYGKLSESFKSWDLIQEEPKGWQASILLLASAFNLLWILAELSKLGDVRYNDCWHKRDGAINIAALYGHREIAKELLDRGADIDAQGINDWTPLHRAAQHGRQLLVKDLLESGANANAVSKDDSRNFTPLHEAIWNGHPSIVILLLEYGADKEARDTDGLTPLLLAVKLGQEDIIPLLLKGDCDISAVDRHGGTAFFHAERHEFIFMLLLQHEAIPRSLFDGSLLCSAVRNCSPRLVSVLLEKGIDINAPDKIGRHPLDYALEQGSPQMISYLVDHAARPALKWNVSSYSVEQWKLEAWFPDLVEGLACADSPIPAPNIRALLPTKVCREDPIAISEDSPDVPYLWIRIPSTFVSVTRIIFTTESHDQGQYHRNLEVQLLMES